MMNALRVLALALGLHASADAQAPAEKPLKSAPETALDSLAAPSGAAADAPGATAEDTTAQSAIPVSDTAPVTKTTTATPAPKASAPAARVGTAESLVSASQPPVRVVAPVTESVASVEPERIGAVATPVTRERLDALPGGDTQPVSNLIAMQPGVVQDSFGANLHVRGAYGSLLYVIDGIPLLSPPPGTVGQLLNTIPNRLVQKLNVYTGGFPVEYSFALGGVVDIQTRRPGPRPQADIRLAYGTYDRVDVAATYAQQIRCLGVLVGGDFITTGRGLDTPDAVTALNADRIGGNAFLKLSYALTDRDHLELLGTFQQDTFHIPIDQTMLPLNAAPAGAIRGSDIYGNPPPPFVPYDAQPTDLERTIFAALSWRHEGPPSYRLALYMREIYEDFDCDPDAVLGGAADPGSKCSNFKRDRYHYGLVGQVGWQWLEHHAFKAGLQVDDAPNRLDFSLFTRNDTVGGPDSAQTLAGGDRINILTGGLYIEDRITFGDLTLQPGVRVDVQSTTFGSTPLPNRTLTGPSVRLGASYALAEPVTLHAFAGYLSEMPADLDAYVVAPLLNPAVSSRHPVNIKPANTWSGQLGMVVRPTPTLTLGIDGWGRLLKDAFDQQSIGDTALWAQFNHEQGWAAGGEVYVTGELVRISRSVVLDVFGNASGQQAKQKDIASLQFLFSPEALAAAQSWAVQGHVQAWTLNAGLMLHDTENRTRLTARFNYGSGLHTGATNNQVVPQHATFDVSFSHTFNISVPTTVAMDAFNIFNDMYAYRLGTAFYGNSRYAPLRQFSVRLICNLS